MEAQQLQYVYLPLQLGMPIVKDSYGSDTCYMYMYTDTAGSMTNPMQTLKERCS